MPRLSLLNDDSVRIRIRFSVSLFAFVSIHEMEDDDGVSAQKIAAQQLENKQS